MEEEVTLRVIVHSEEPKETFEYEIWIPCGLSDRIKSFVAAGVAFENQWVDVRVTWEVDYAKVR